MGPGGPSLGIQGAGAPAGMYGDPYYSRESARDRDARERDRMVLNERERERDPRERERMERDRAGADRDRDVRMGGPERDPRDGRERDTPRMQQLTAREVQEQQRLASINRGGPPGPGGPGSADERHAFQLQQERERLGAMPERERMSERDRERESRGRVDLTERERMERMERDRIPASERDRMAMGMSDRDRIDRDRMSDRGDRDRMGMMSERERHDRMAADRLGDGRMGDSRMGLERMNDRERDRLADGREPKRLKGSINKGERPG